MDTLNAVAERYVRLVLAVGEHDPDYVDAYYGPPEWKLEAGQSKTPLDGIESEAGRLANSMPAAPASGDELVQLRHEYLRRQLEALATRVRILSGAVLK